MKRRINEKGTALVEFAIVLPLLIILIFGIIEFGLLLFNRQIITNACREGTRAGIVQVDPQDTRLTDSEISSIVNGYCASHLITFGATSDPVTTVTRVGSSFSDPLTVQVAYTYSFLVLPNFISGISGNISVQTVMLME